MGNILLGHGDPPKYLIKALCCGPLHVQLYIHLEIKEDLWLLNVDGVFRSLGTENEKDRREHQQHPEGICRQAGWAYNG